MFIGENLMSHYMEGRKIYQVYSQIVGTGALIDELILQELGVRILYLKIVNSR